MTLTIFDPCTGTRVQVEVPVRAQAARRARRWLLRELDQATRVGVDGAAGAVASKL